MITIYEQSRKPSGPHLKLHSSVPKKCTSQNPVVIRNGLHLNLYVVIKMTRQIQSPVVIWSLTCFLYLVLLIYLQSFFVLILSLTCFLYVVLLAYLHSFFVLHSFSVFRIKVVLCIESVLCIYTHSLYVPVLLKMTLCLKLCSSFLFARYRASFIADMAGLAKILKKNATGRVLRIPNRF